MDNTSAEFAREIALTAARETAEILADGIAKGRFLPPAAYLTPAQTAAYLSTTEGALETMRKERRGPRYSRPSHKMVRYARSDLDAWMDESKSATAE
jgi:predicted DNA-binding transcriptional regulator AlpA